jgi:hypothetical protein
MRIGGDAGGGVYWAGGRVSGGEVVGVVGYGSEPQTLALCLVNLSCFLYSCFSITKCLNSPPSHPSK